MNFNEWNKIKSLPVIETVIIDDVLPEVNVIKEEILIGRTEINEFDKKMWKQIDDVKIASAAAKKNFVESYFSTCIYILKRIKNLPLATNQGYKASVTLSHESTYRKSTTESTKIENTLKTGVNVEGFSVENSLTFAYGLEKLDEYIDVNKKETTEEVNYEPINEARNIVFWDLIKLIAIYRKDYKGNIELIRYGDFYVETRQKEYYIKRTAVS